MGCVSHGPPTAATGALIFYENRAEPAAVFVEIQSACCGALAEGAVLKAGFVFRPEAKDSGFASRPEVKVSGFAFRPEAKDTARGFLLGFRRRAIDPAS